MKIHLNSIYVDDQEKERLKLRNSYLETYTKSTLASELAKARTESETTYTKAISKKLSTPVSVRHTAKGGQLIIKFTSEKDLKRIIKQIG